MVIFNYYMCNMFALCLCDYNSDVRRSRDRLAHFQAASWLYMDDLWLITEVQSLLNSSELQEPINGHVVQVVHVEMWKMNLRACKEKRQQWSKREQRSNKDTEILLKENWKRQENSPGPAMMAPPCWYRSPWKSNAGLVMALHILFIWPIKIPDFTWGLGWALHINRKTQLPINYHLGAYADMYFCTVINVLPEFVNFSSLFIPSFW